MKTTGIRIPPFGLPGTLCVPNRARGLVILAHGSEPKSLRIRNTLLAATLNAREMATLQFEFLSAEEEKDETNITDIRLLTVRLIQALRWAREEERVAHLPVGLMGIDTGGAAALVTAAALDATIKAVVSWDGRPDLAAADLAHVHAPTLFVTGDRDAEIIAAMEDAVARLAEPKAFAIVSGSIDPVSHPEALGAAIDATALWFEHYLMSA